MQTTDELLDAVGEVVQDGWALKTHTEKFEHEKRKRSLTITLERDESGQLNLFQQDGQDGQHREARV